MSDPDQEATMQTIAEMLMERGWKEGWEEGWKEGWEEGRREFQRAFLVNGLALQFGQEPESVARRVEAADAEMLERWCLRLVTARSLDDVFEI